MCEYIAVREYCPCPAGPKCRRADEGIETPFGLRHLATHQPGRISKVCKQRQFIMSSEAFPTRDCLNTAAASKAGGSGDACIFRAAEKMCNLCTDFCGMSV